MHPQSTEKHFLRSLERSAKFIQRMSDFEASNYTDKQLFIFFSFSFCVLFADIYLILYRCADFDKENTKQF
jgi:hypothetical protein